MWLAPIFSLLISSSLLYFAFNGNDERANRSLRAAQYSTTVAIRQPIRSVQFPHEEKTTLSICECFQMPESGIDWNLTTWEEATREQLRRWAALSLEEIVRAQEEMQDLAERLGTSASDT